MANDTAKRLMARVKELRLALGLSQEAFAEKAGLKYKHYQSVEAGRKTDFRLSTIEKIAKALGLKLAQLMDFDVPLTAMAEDPPAGGKTKRGKAGRKPRPKSGG